MNTIFGPFNVHNKASVNGNIVSAPHEVYLRMRAGGISLSKLFNTSFIEYV